MALPSITDFEILQKLGSGSYASVYKVRNKETRKYHAIKYVKMSSLSTSSRENLISEIRVLRDLNYKYIVSLQDFFWDDKNIYIVLEYCDLGSLSEYIHFRKCLQEDICSYFMRQLAGAMQYMRANDVSHFDLKPQNLLLTHGRNRRAYLKVADFGFAQHLKLGEQNEQIKGSPLYMAPEIVRKKRYDAKADLWSIGVILYECLFGKAPYKSKTIEELLLRIRNAEPITLPPNAHISNECDDLLQRLLVHDPTKRISFDDFFAHPFLDLETLPTEKTFKKAIDLVQKAINYDGERKYKDAYHYYCHALRFFVPILNDEDDACKRVELRNRIMGYMTRAEELSQYLCQEERKRRSEEDAEGSDDNALNELKAQRMAENKKRETIQKRDIRLKQLSDFARTCPTLKGALDIGIKAELYQYDKQLEAALETYTSALAILVKFVNDEPQGLRRQLILRQIDIWIKEGERIKSIVNAKRMTAEEQKLSLVRSCTIQ